MTARLALYSLLTAILILLAAIFWRVSRPPPPDVRLIDLSVRSTVAALPTSTPRVIEVTRIVTVVAPPPAAVAATPTLSATVTPTPTPLALAPDAPAQEVAFAAPPAAEAAASAAAAPAPEQAVAAAVGPAPDPGGCPASSGRSFDAIPVASGPIEHPDSIHGDLNLAQRGYAPVDAQLSLVDIDGPADGDPPQLAGLFADGRVPFFSGAFQVYDWNWGCADHGCRGELLTHREVLLLSLQVQPGEEVRSPRRDAQIYGGGYVALVLYAEPTRITLGYTREDGVANGYAVHIENVCVDPALLGLYRADNAAGRGSLPGLRNGETLGTAAIGDIAVAVRDRGEFFDPRSRKDWWRGF